MARDKAHTFDGLLRPSKNRTAANLYHFAKRSLRFGAPATATRDIAKYFVPAPVIKAFTPPGVTY
jgi:hypothetical protein